MVRNQIKSDNKFSLKGRSDGFVLRVFSKEDAIKVLKKLRSEGHIYKRTNKEECKQHNVMDDKIYEDSTQLYGLKKF